MDLSQTEIMVIVGCAVLGWIIVSRLLPSDMGKPPVTENTPWHEALDVSPQASADEIEAAFMQRVAELDEQMPAVPTLPEQSAHHENKRLLQRACEQGLAAARNS